MTSLLKAKSPARQEGDSAQQQQQNDMCIVSKLGYFFNKGATA